MVNRLETRIQTLRMRTPLMTASGTSGSSEEIQKLRDNVREPMLSSLGAFVSKGVTLSRKQGNPELRVIETRTGLLNSIGLQNKGAKFFTEDELPFLLRYELPIIVNISAGSAEQFAKLAAYLLDRDVNETIAGIEINVSCPNLHAGGKAFGENPREVERIVRAVKKRVANRALVITKLTPNVTDIALPASAAIAGGTDALSMINTLRGMAINVEDGGKPFLGNVYGGLSGPAIKPVGIFMVYECFRRIPECRNRKIPIVGIGGISNWRDALEYIMAGATAVGVGTAWFVNPGVFAEIRAGLEKYLKEHKTTVTQLVGKSHEA